MSEQAKENKPEPLNYRAMIYEAFSEGFNTAESPTKKGLDVTDHWERSYSKYKRDRM